MMLWPRFMLCLSMELMSWILGSGTLNVRIDAWFSEPRILYERSDLAKLIWLFDSKEAASREAELLLSP